MRIRRGTDFVERSRRRAGREAAMMMRGASREEKKRGRMLVSVDVR